MSALQALDGGGHALETQGGSPDHTVLAGVPQNYVKSPSGVLTPSSQPIAPVAELRPATMTAETQPLDRFGGEPVDETESHSEPEQKLPEPPEPPEVPTAVGLPSEPVQQVYLGTNQFKWTFWASVVVGLVGQVIGYGPEFGGTALSYVAAVFVGGIFEFIMVSWSGAGFTRLAEGRKWWEYGFYLAFATGAAAFAAWMNFTHWTLLNDNLAAFFGGLTVFGYCGHVMHCLFDALRKRRKRTEWRGQVQQLQSMQQDLVAMAESARADYTRKLAAYQRQLKTTSAKPKATPVVTQTAPTPVPAEESEMPAAEYEDAELVAFLYGAREPRELREALQDALGLATGHPNTLTRWRKKVMKLDENSIPEAYEAPTRRLTEAEIATARQQWEARKTQV